MEKITIMLRVGVTELNIGFENREEAKKCCLEVMEEASATGISGDDTDRIHDAAMVVCGKLGCG